MPPKETDGDWLTGGIGELYIGTPDGGYVPYDGFPVIEEGYIMTDIVTDEEVKRYNFSPIGDFSFTAKIKLSHKTQIEMARRMKAITKILKRFNNVMRRFIRTEKRLKEQERRKRLKEEQHEPR